METAQSSVVVAVEKLEPTDKVLANIVDHMLSVYFFSPPKDLCELILLIRVIDVNNYPSGHGVEGFLVFNIRLILVKKVWGCSDS